MKVLIAGGSGFIGAALARGLENAGHLVWILTRRTGRRENEIEWDGKTTAAWSDRIAEMDAVVNITGFGLNHWPWTAPQKKRFLESRVIPARALVAAIVNSPRPPQVFVQISGINYYGSRGAELANELTPPGDDYLAQLTVAWEAASSGLEAVGVRCIVARSGIVLDSHGGLFPILALPVRCFVGGRLGNGRQAVAWIHRADHVRALRFLIEDGQSRGAYNLVAPTFTSNEQFMRAVAVKLRRPYWLPVPAMLIREVLGELSVLAIEGRRSRPARLLDSGFEFKYPTIETALDDLLKARGGRGTGES